MKDKTNFTIEELHEDKILSVENIGKDNFLQPIILDKYGAILAHKTKLRDDAKALLKSTRADVFIDIKMNSQDYDFKLTDAIIANLVDSDEEVKELTLALNKAEEGVNRANSAYWSIKDKGTRLDRAVTIYVTGYWGELSQLPSKMQEDIDAYVMKEEMSQSLTKKLKRRKKNGDRS